MCVWSGDKCRVSAAPVCAVQSLMQPSMRPSYTRTWPSLHAHSSSWPLWLNSAPPQLTPAGRLSEHWVPQRTGRGR